MKILIQNYSSPISSEPLYFNQTFSNAEGLESRLWSPNSIGVFDVFDKFNPNVFICHHLGLNRDELSYLSGDDQIKVAINITNIEQQNLEVLEKTLKENNINCTLMFSNNYDFIDQCKPKDFKYEKILPCADIYFSPSQIPDFKLDAAIISSGYNENFKDLEQKFSSYHKMKIDIEKDENFDLIVNVIMLSSLYDKYEEFIICDSVDIAFSQIFFDAFLKSKKVSVKLPESEQKFFTKILSEIFEEEEEEDMMNKIKTQIKNNHTCLNRSKQLLEAIL